MYVKGEKADHFHVLRLNWELVGVHSPALQNDKLELENALVTSDPQWSIVVSTEGESGGFLFRKGVLQSQVLSMSLAASESYRIFLQPAILMTALQRLQGHFQIFVF